MSHVECAICLRGILTHRSHLCAVYDVVLPCGHMFHFKCISKWLNHANTCPKCRSEINSETYMLYENAGDLGDMPSDLDYIPEKPVECTVERKCRYSKRLVRKLKNLRH